VLFFFFSSRRRHTRFSRDWSSDVCSSDLELHTSTTESRRDSLRFLKKRGFEENKRDPKSRLEVTNFDWNRFYGLETQIAAMGIRSEERRVGKEGRIGSMHERST